jgi:hypothetical protein
VVTSLIAIGGCEQIIGIGDPQLGTGTEGGGGSADGGTPSTGGEGGEGEPPPCHPTDPVCNQVASDCLALVDNSERDVGALRLQQLTIFKPDALSSGLEYQAIAQSVMINLEECNLFGGGTINLLVEMNRSAGTARIGGAYPVEDPNDGYTFVDDLFPVEGGMIEVAPQTFDAEVDQSGTITAGTVPFVTLPLFLSPDASDYILMPVREARLIQTQISQDYNCIGTHNAEGLSPDNGCLPDIPGNVKPFVDGGRVEGYILLEEADDVIVTTFGLNRSLCVIFAQDVAEFGDGGSPTRCAYKDNEIKFPGDWCSQTNSGATAECHDAVKFLFSFAASAVKVDP